MATISEIVLSEFRSLSKEIDLDTDLNPVLPDFYDFESEYPIVLGLINLKMEMMEYGKPTKVRVSTRSRRGMQVVEIAWDGKPIDKDYLGLINSRYKWGAERKDEPKISGTMIAGYFLNKVGARIRIENFEDDGYRVRNIVEFPFDYKTEKRQI